MEGEVEQDKSAYTPCTRTSCRKRSVCCDCIRKHLAQQQMPNCWKDYHPSTSLMVCIRGTLTVIDISKLNREKDCSLTANEDIIPPLCPLGHALGQYPTNPGDFSQ